MQISKVDYVFVAQGLAGKFEGISTLVNNYFHTMHIEYEAE